MRFRIKEIGDEGLSLDLPITAAWLTSECPDLEVALAPGGLKVKGQLLQAGDDVFLRANLRGVLIAPCSRCLETARVPVDVPMTVTFKPKEESKGRDSDDDDEDDSSDLDLAIYDGDEVDLTSEVRDQILLAIPIKPLCREVCLGLCSVCGGNRNQVACDCESRAAAAQAPLATVLGKLKM